MKFTAVLVALCVASSNAAPARKRTKQQHKSVTGARSTESYDPYLGVAGRNLADSSMSMDEPAGSASKAGAAVGVLAAAGAMMLL